MGAIQNMFAAIEVMTQWSLDGPTSDRPTVTAHLNGLDDEETKRVVQGLISLCGELMIGNAYRGGPPVEVQLQEFGRTMAALAAFGHPPA